MFLLISNRNSKTTTLDITTKRENLNYILKFGLFANVTQYINLRLILYNVYIDNSTITSDIKVNLWVFNCLESYQLSPSLIINLILEIFCEKFHKWRYIKFSRLDYNIKPVLKKTFMVKKICKSRPSDYINQCLLTNFVINEQLLI